MMPWWRELGGLGRLAVPLVLAQLAQNGMGVVDTLMVARLGPDALAGIALGNAAFSFVMIFEMAVLLAVGPMVSQAHGARRPDEAARAGRQGLWLAVGLSLPTLVLFHNVRPLLLLAGQDPAIATSAAGYMQAVAWGLPFVLALTALRGFLEGHGDTRPILVVAALGVGLNVVANDLLMYGRWGLPRLGLMGTGYATAVVYAAMAVAVAVYLRLRYRRYRLFAGLRHPDAPTMREIVRIGFPIGLTLGFEVGMFMVTALLIGRFGDAALAGHQIALQTASTTFMVPLGIGTAAGIRVGQAAGRGDPVGIARGGTVGIVLSALFMFGAAVTFWSVPDAVIGLYLNVGDPANAEVVRFARTFLFVAGAFQVFDGIQVSASGALRGLKDTRRPMLLTLVAYWLVAVPLGAWLAFGAGIGAVGLWYGLVAGLAIAAGLLATRFFRSRRAAAPAVALPGGSELR